MMRTRAVSKVMATAPGLTPAALAMELCRPAEALAKSLTLTAARKVRRTLGSFWLGDRSGDGGGGDGGGGDGGGGGFEAARVVCFSEAEDEEDEEEEEGRVEGRRW